MTMMHKCVTGIEETDKTDYITPTSSITRDHSRKILKVRTKKYKKEIQFFSQRYRLVRTTNYLKKLR